MRPAYCGGHARAPPGFCVESFPEHPRRPAHGRGHGEFHNQRRADQGGVVGVLIVVRPGMAGFSQYALLALLSVAFCAVRDLATRSIPGHLPSLFISLLTTVTVTTAGAVVLVPLGGWTPPSAHALGLLA